MPLVSLTVFMNQQEKQNCIHDKHTMSYVVTGEVPGQLWLYG